MLRRLKLKTKKNGLVEISHQVKETVSNSGVLTGLCVVSIPHTTAGLTITSYRDPKGHEDIHDEYNRLIPTRIDFKHREDTPQDAAGHVKSTIAGATLSLIIEDSQLMLGHSQGLFFVEFDGPRNREYFVKILQG